MKHLKSFNESLKRKGNLDGPTNNSKVTHDMFVFLMDEIKKSRPEDETYIKGSLDHLNNRIKVGESILNDILNYLEESYDLEYSKEVWLKFCSKFDCHPCIWRVSAWDKPQ